MIGLRVCVGRDVIKKNPKSLQANGRPRLIHHPHSHALIPWIGTRPSLILLTICLLLSLTLLPLSVLAVESAPFGATHKLGSPTNVVHTPGLEKLAKVESSVLMVNNAGEAGGIQVVFELTEAKKDYVDALQKEGVTIQSVHEDLVQGLATIQQILSLSQLEFIRYIRRPLHPIPLKVVSEGVAVIQANLAAQNGLTGRGVKVAVIDGGFNVANPEIAANVKEAKSFRADRDLKGDEPAHGTACAEIIVDVAPDVELYLYNVDTDVDFLNAVDYAVSREVKVISISLGWFNMGPYDGTSGISKALDSARQKGVLPVVAAGNEARTHWMGVFTDSDGNGWHEFAGRDETNSISLRAGAEVALFLSWDDWPRSSQDYDLYLYDSNHNIVARSRNRQNGSQWPIEELGYMASVTGTYYIAIWNSSATRAVTFHLFGAEVREFRYFVESSSLANLADSRGAMTVGATYWANDKLENFSCRGPTVDGRTKPDIAAPDGVSTSSYGYRGFFGTSAAAPHVAGSAALMFAANPSLSADEVASILEKGSINLGPPGKNNLYGAGRVRVSFASFNVSPKVSSLIIDETTYSPTQLPVVLIWTPGTTHSFSVLSTTVGGTDARHTFTGWTDNNTPLSSSQAATLTFAGGPRILIASFKSQFLLTVTSPYGNPKGGGWYDSGAMASFSVTTPVDHGNLTRRAFLAWSGDSTSKSASASLTMDSPKTVIATWGIQYYVTVQSIYGGVKGEGWYDKGGAASISVEKTVDHGNLTRRVFTSWFGDLTSTQPSATIQVDSPKRAVADWKKQYYLTVTPNGGQVTGEGWYDYNSYANATATTPLNVVAEKSRLIFTKWTGDITSEPPTVTIRMTQPRVLEANWKQQYSLTVNSPYGSPKGAGWYDEKATAQFEVTSPVDYGNATRHVFTGWSSDSTATTPSTSIAMDAPKTVAANWKKQYSLTVNSPYGSPTGSGWYDADSSATFSVASSYPVEGFMGALGGKYVFQSWSGDFTAATPTATMKMDTPKTVTATWTTDLTMPYAVLGGIVVAIGVAVGIVVIRMRKIE